MVKTYVSLKHPSVNGGVAVQIYCTTVTVTFNKKNDKSPVVNYDISPVAVQTTGRENLQYQLSGVKLDKGDLDYATLLEFYSLPNDELMELVVIYNTKNLTDSTGLLTSIPVTFDSSFNIKFDTVDSVDANLPVLSIPLIEVATS